jgi:hypothetical protein
VPFDFNLEEGRRGCKIKRRINKWWVGKFQFETVTLDNFHQFILQMYNRFLMNMDYGDVG